MRSFKRLKCQPLVLAASLMLLSACSTHKPSSTNGGDDGIFDRAPSNPADVSNVTDAVPRHEPRTRAGNKNPYQQWGKTYHLLPDSKGYSERGEASWYGEKFHGRRTANGEVYNMYGMSAAHKTLPIPSYVRVTNVANGRQVVVRVNDRGPFHGNRIIDLSYAAASRLGFTKQGTAKVKVEGVQPGEDLAAQPAVQSLEVQSEVNTSPVVLPAPMLSAPVAVKLDRVEKVAETQAANAEAYQLPANTFLQAGAFSSQQAAEAIKDRILTLTELPVTVTEPALDTLFRVRIGPISNNLMMMALREMLEIHSLPIPHVVYE